MVWNPEKYLQFGDERTQPARDLLARIAAMEPKRVLDVGCGPGNSTALLAERWPAAEIVAIDGSPEMIAMAKKSRQDISWLEMDAGGDVSGLGAFGVVFSNAAIQWIPDHAALLPRLFSLVAPGGVLAVQAPNNEDSPIHKAVREIVACAAWRDRIPLAQAQIYDSPWTYYDIVAPLTPRLALWECVYYHIMNTMEDVLDWQRGTNLRQYLDQLPDEAAKEELLGEVRTRTEFLYPRQADGRILYPFKRLFFTAVKPEGE